MITKNNINLHILDASGKLTPYVEEIKKYNFMVVKVIIPKLHPLYLDERYPYLEGDRLYNTPVKMGILEKPNKENQLNKIPHPFL